MAAAPAALPDDDTDDEPPTPRARPATPRPPSGALDDLALVAVLDENADALAAARRLLLGEVRASLSNVALGYDLLQPYLSADEQQRYLARATPLFQRYLTELGPLFLLSAGGNMRTTPLCAALTQYLAIVGDPGVPPLDAARDELLRNFAGALTASLGADGYPAEDIGYGTMMAGRFGQVASCLRRAGLYDAYAASPRLAGCGQALLHFVQPWGEFLSNTGDHSDEFRDRELLLAHLARVNGDPALTWLLGTLVFPPLDAERRAAFAGSLAETELAPGLRVPTTAIALLVLPDAPRPVRPAAPPVPTAFRDRDRGIVSFRSGWGDDDAYVYFDGSQRPSAALGHGHDSGGHFSLSALGEYFAVGPGRYGIEQDQHNVMLVDGKSGRSTDGRWTPSPYQGRLLAYQPGTLCDYAAVDYSQQANCTWAVRHLGLVKAPELPAGAYVWTLDDVNAANDYRAFWWTLYSEPGNQIALAGDHATITGRRHGAQLDVHFALPAPAEYPKPHTLTLTQDQPFTSSFKYVSRATAQTQAYRTVHHAVYFRPRLVAQVQGYNGRMLTVLVPRPASAPAPRVAALPTLPGALALRLTFADVQDTLITALGHRLLEADGVRAVGAWVVVRRRRADGRMLTHALGEGELIEVDGRALPRTAPVAG